MVEIRARCWASGPAECLKQRRSVRVARRLRLHQADAGLLVTLLRAKQREVAGVAALPLLLRQIQCDFGRIGGARGGLEALGILLQRHQGVGDVLEGAQHGAAVLLRGLSVRSLRSPLLVQEGAALEQRRGRRGADGPEAGAFGEQLVYGERGAACVSGQLNVGQAVGNGDANFRARVVQIRLCLAHVGALRDERRGQAHRQLLGQLQTRQLQFLGGRLVRKAAHQGSQEVAQLRLLFHERRQGGRHLGELRFLRGDVESARVTLGELVLDDLQGAALGVQQLPRRLDLQAHRAVLDRGDDDVGHQRVVGRNHLEARFLLLCAQ